MAGKLSSFLGSYGVFSAAVGVIGISAGAYYYQSSSAPQPPVVLVSPDVVPSIAPEASVSDPEPAVQTGPTPPKFDVVRVEVDGGALIAGKAVPHSQVTVLIDGEAGPQVLTDQAGNFVVLFEIAPSDAPRVLTLSMVAKGQGEIVSDDSVIISPSILADVDDEPAVTASSSVNDPQTSGSGTVEQMASAVLPKQDGEALDVTPSPNTQAPSDARNEPVAAVTPTAQTPIPEIAVIEDVVEPAVQQPPTVLLATGEGISVLQGPTVLQSVVLDSITYDQSGEVQLAGRGGEQGFVRIYLNNAPIQTAEIAETGTWRTPLPDVDTGIYTLRIDQVDAQGVVMSRVETPFLRESAAVLENAGQLTQTPPQPDLGDSETLSENIAPKVAVITVQPGSTLWAIAQEKYGDGALYVRVFEANQGNIRNPDLIYPGQVFSVPDDVPQ